LTESILESGPGTIRYHWKYKKYKY